MNDLLSINDAANRCKTEGIPLSEKAIRRFVKSGDLPAVHNPNGNSITFDPAGIDMLIEILQSIKADGVDSVL